MNVFHQDILLLMIDFKYHINIHNLQSA